MIRPLLLAAACTVALSACASRPKPPAGSLAATSPSAGHAPGGAVNPMTPGEAGAQPGSQAHLAASAGDRVFFAYDSTELDETARDTLRRQASWLGQFGQARAVIEGHADERGTREYNLALGAKRAEEVRRFLIAQGVSSARLRTISYGKERPFDASGTEDAFARNRNGHTLIDGGFAR